MEELVWWRNQDLEPMAPRQHEGLCLRQTSSSPGGSVMPEPSLE